MKMNIVQAKDKNKITAGNRIANKHPFLIGFFPSSISK
ncbi:hypothetical protein LEP1GSC058_1508 [Leptospira fainei serovar Hurstbridge str. BUT 6]|uniref:Uncharacterized protein n=1 Tax=Leptospira fainei serovar Hurstbridge str. BUT 6 TaxID=1193011 RepID=S3V2V3_9LEPT|nr:hypothetical protein LEP1GSC058_1508 [Leptospira fainei serovar Hurstbridge str. BUT 6]